MKRSLLLVVRIVVGLLFIFSGLVKENDPIGFAYKLEEYFVVFHVQFLNGISVGLAIFLCALEVFLGVAIILGAYARKVALGLLLLIIFFTFLTFYSAFFKVVQSCGCFGDAIPLTPWQSFSKDLILLVLILVIYRYRNSISPLVASRGAQNTVIGIALLFTIAFPVYVVRHLPVIDFLPYKVGASIPDEMRIPPGSSPNEYEVMYNMKNKSTGKTRRVSDKEYLKSGIWKDSNWDIVGEPEQRLVKKGFEPKIADLKISDAQGTDYTREIIENPFYNFVVVADQLDETNEEALRRINALAVDMAENYNIRTVLLTSNAAQDAENMSKQLKLVFEVFYADGVPLKMMVRANPGILLLRNGTVINKWNFRDMPDYQSLVNRYLLKE